MSSAVQAQQRKEVMYAKTQDLFSKYRNFMVLGIHRVESTQLKNIIAAIGDKFRILIAKNKIIKKALSDLDANRYADIISKLHGNVILAFYDDEDPKRILEISVENMRKAHAVAGDTAPLDVVIPAGPTGLGPEKITIFQAARMNTKINKAKIDLVTDHRLVTAGNVVTISEANLLAMLNILPFEFGVEILQVFENGETYGKSVLQIKEDEITSMIRESVGRLAAVSLGTDTATPASLPFEIRNAYADVMKVSLALDFSINAN